MLFPSLLVALLYVYFFFFYSLTLHPSFQLNQDFFTLKLFLLHRPPLAILSLLSPFLFPAYFVISFLLDIGFQDELIVLFFFFFPLQEMRGVPFFLYLYPSLFRNSFGAFFLFSMKWPPSSLLNPLYSYSLPD